MFILIFLIIKKILSHKKDLIEFCVDHLINKEGEANKKKVFSAYKKFSVYLSPLEKDLSTEYLGKKLGVNKETLINELSFKENLTELIISDFSTHLTDSSINFLTSTDSLFTNSFSFSLL